MHSALSFLQSKQRTQIWNITNQPPVPETTFNATGNVRHLEVMGNTVLWSVDEPLVAEQNPLLVGTIYMMLGDGSSSAIRVCHRTKLVRIKYGSDLSSSSLSRPFSDRSTCPARTPWAKSVISKSNRWVTPCT